MNRQNALEIQNQRKTLRSKHGRWVLSCAAFVALGCAQTANAQISQSLGYGYSASGFRHSLSVDHSVSGIEVGILDLGFNHSTGYNLTAGSLNDYDASLDINDDENFFGSLTGVYGETFRSVGGFADNQFETDWLSVALSGSASLEWSQSTFEDQGWEDPDFEPYDYTEEELAAIVWAQSYFADASIQIDGNRFSIGRVKVRPSTEGRLDRSDYNGTSYEGSVGVGFALAPPTEDDEFDFFFEESNLSADVIGGSYGGGDGELVLAAGYDSEGLGRIAALIFKGFSLNDDVDLGFDATGSVQFDNEGSFAFYGSALQITGDFRLTEDIGISSSATIDIDENLNPSYSFSTSLDLNDFRNFSPSIRFSSNYSNGSGGFSIPFGVSTSLSEFLSVSVDVSPSYSTYDKSTDVELSGSVSLQGPSITENGGSTSFSISGSAGVFSGERSVSLSGSMNF